MGWLAWMILQVRSWESRLLHHVVYLLQPVACVFSDKREERIWRSTEDRLSSRNGKCKHCTHIPLSRTSIIFSSNASEKSLKDVMGKALICFS